MRVPDRVDYSLLDVASFILFQRVRTDWLG